MGFMEPGLLGLPAFCSGDQAVLVLVQLQEGGSGPVSLLGAQQTDQGILGRNWEHFSFCCNSEPN